MSLFNPLSHISTVWTEERLVIDITALRQAFERHEIGVIGLIRSRHTMPDASTTRPTEGRYCDGQKAD